MFFLLYRHTDDGVIDDFPKISDHFPKILQNLSKGGTNIAEHFPKFSKIVEDCRRLSRKTRTCFDPTPTNLSTI